MKQALPAHPTAVAALGGMLRDRLSDVLPPRKIAQVELLTSELVTNAVLHARLNEGDPIAIEIEAGPTKVHVSVIDAGIGFNFAKTSGNREDATGGWVCFSSRASRTAGESSTHLHTVSGSRLLAPGMRVGPPASAYMAG